MIQELIGGIAKFKPSTVKVALPHVRHSDMIGDKCKLHEPPPARVNDLPYCLLGDIFLRLPLITAHRCKLVCKRWHSVISEPYFADRFSQDEKLSTQLLGYYHFSRKVYLYNCNSYSYHLNKELPFDFIESNIRVEASSNDLLLCMAQPFTKEHHYLVCNPVTRKWVRLPTFPSLPPPYPNAYRTWIGFTSKKSGEFAVITINYHAYEFFNSIIWVLSSNTLEWVQKPFPRRFKKPGTSTSNHAGFPYKGQCFFYEQITEEIICIDPSNASAENWWLFTDPPKGFIPRRNSNNYKCNAYLGLCRKTLRFCQISMEIGNNDLTLRVWDLKRQAEWILYRHVLLPDMVIEHRYGAPIYVKDCHPNDPDIIYLGGFFQKETLSFNISTCEMEKVHPIPPYESCSFYGVVPCNIQWRPTPLPSLEE